MNVLWFTGRRFDNFCSTTQASLANGLVEKGHLVHILNPDKQGSHNDKPWKHTGFSLSSIIGLQSRNLSLKMKAWLKNHQQEHDTVAIVDWRVLGNIHSSLRKKKIPWILMDRSPPADKGLLSFLQWPVWGKSWRRVAESENTIGCVVSSRHQQLVKSKTILSSNRFTIIPAGVDLQLFSPKTKDKVLTMVYHGRLDKHRGILSLPMLANKSIEAGIKLKLHLIGEGDCLNQLQKLAKSCDYIEVDSNMDQSKVANVLARSHIGLLPMPDTNLWSIASPLKRSEYAASGMLIFGIDHAGHRLDKEPNMDWIKLVAQHNFYDHGIDWMKSLDSNELENMSKSAREYAEKNLSWHKSIEALESALNNQLN